MKFNDETGLHQVAQLNPPEAAPPTMKFTYATGDRPLDGYTIKRGIGSGGFGEVYYATSEGGKQVALKMVRRHLDIELRGVNQCLNLKHPNLVVLYDVKQAESGDCWVIMEYMSGESLAEVIARHPQGMPREQAVAYLRGICEGVSHLHTHGIVHRDLKPGNVFTEDGSIKVGDYGLAKFMSVSRRSGQTESVGTVHYMAPELSQGRYGKEIDLYAVGIMLYEMLTGRVPFEGESAGEILMKHLTAEPDLSRLSEPYRSVVKRALAKDPMLRYPSMQAMLEDLDARLAMPAAVASPSAAAPHAAQFQGVPGWKARPRSMAALNSARALADKQLVKGFASILARLLIAIFFGVGTGLLIGGISVILLQDELAAAFVGGGSGTLTAALLLILICSAVPGRHRVWPLLAALFLGVGTGFLVCGLVSSAESGSGHELTAGLGGTGCGLLTAGLAAYGLFTWFGVPLSWRWVLLVPMLAAGAGFSAGALGSFIGVGEAVVGMVSVGTGSLTLAILLCLLFFGRMAQRLNGRPALDPADQRTQTARGARHGFHAGSFDWLGIHRNPLVAGMAVLLAVVATALTGAAAVFLAAGGDRSIPYIGGPAAPPTEVVEWELHRFTGHNGAVQCVAFNHDGTRLASGSVDATIRIWNVSDTPSEHRLIPQQSHIHCIAFSPDGTRLAAAAHHPEVTIWDANNGTEVSKASQPGPVYAVAFSRNGDQVATGSADNVVRTFDAQTGLPGRQFFGCDDEIHALAFGPVGNTLAAAGRRGGSIRLWDAATGRQKTSFAGPPVEFLAFSPDGQELAAGGNSNEVCVWRLDQPGQHRRILPTRCTGLAYGPAGRQLAVATRETIELWDTASSRLLCKFAGKHHSPTCVVFHPDGSRLASGGQDATIRLWEIPEHLQVDRKMPDQITVEAPAYSAEAPERGETTIELGPQPAGAAASSASEAATVLEAPDTGSIDAATDEAED